MQNSQLGAFLTVPDGRLSGCLDTPAFRDSPPAPVAGLGSIPGGGAISALSPGPGWLTQSTSTHGAGAEDAGHPVGLPGAPQGEPDDLADALVGPASALARAWLLQSAQKGRGPSSLRSSRAERARTARLHRITADPHSLAFAMGFCDRVLRPPSARVSARQMRRLVSGARSKGGLPRFLQPPDRQLLRLGAAVSAPLPGVVMPLARRRLRALVGDLVADVRDPALARHLARLRAEGFSLNLNLLGEAVLGHAEAARRRAAVIELMARPDVDYVSVKVSSVCAQVNLWAYGETLERTKDALREILLAARRQDPPVFVNLDMEEYKDLELTIGAFTALLDEPALCDLESGVVLQAYLPESLDALRRLTAWAVARRARGGARIKVRIVKGANLAAERVDSAVHGWSLAPYSTKAETDANHKAMVEYALRPQHTAALSVGVAGHNLFDVAWAHLLAEARGVESAVSFEMLQGMAPATARTVLATTGQVLLYTPVVAPADFDHALAYLFRRLEENGGGENFLASLPALDEPAVFERERERFAAAVAGRALVRHARSRGPAEVRLRDDGFGNEPDTDPTDSRGRRRVVRALGASALQSLPDPLELTGADAVVEGAASAAQRWAGIPAQERATVLERSAEALEQRRAALVAMMAAEGGKTLAEADTEVSEAVDFARYYAVRARELDHLDGARTKPLGVVVVAGPWNFPLAIPSGGALAALAAGNAVVMKPAPQTPTIAFAAAQAFWDSGVPRDALQYVRCPDGPVGSRLVAHPGVSALLLTGSYETAELFTRLAPSTPLMAETSGKNAMVVMPEADFDEAAADLARSAFGHSGQKCSAASLAILVGETATSGRFRSQLVDAVCSLEVGPPTSAASTMGPLIEPPSEKLQRALTTLEDHQCWLLEPRALNREGTLWSPGIIDGVRPDDWFARTECFGPVLGLVAARDLDHALAIQNALPFGLTGGICSLDPRDCTHWVDRAEVGNAYVNRPVTGAIVGRQPFGGYKRSVVGPGAKAGGPNYVLQLCEVLDEDGALPALRAEPVEPVRGTLSLLRAGGGLSATEWARLEAAAASDAYWWASEFGVEHDPAGLFCEANVFRYRPLPHVIIRAEVGAPLFAVYRALLAALAARSHPALSVGAGVDLPPAARTVPDVAVMTESQEQLVARLVSQPRARVRLFGSPDASLPGLAPDVHVDARPPVLLGRIELLRYLREQTVSRTLHRFGNVVPSPDG